jgi:hypothetical protein
MIPRQRIMSGAFSFKAAKVFEIPVGTIMAWDKTLSGVSLPDGWVECNGQTLSDTDSPLNQKKIPNLNGYSGGAKAFLRGNTASNTFSGVDTHTHSVSVNGGSKYIPLGYLASGNGWGIGYDGNGHGYVMPQVASENSNVPYNYSVVWIMKVK